MSNRFYNDDAKKDLLFLQQFIWIRKGVLNEQQNMKELDENEADS